MKIYAVVEHYYDGGANGWETPLKHFTTLDKAETFILEEKLLDIDKYGYSYHIEEIEVE